MVQIYIPERIRDRLKKHAVARKVSITALIYPALEELLKTLGKKNGGKKTK